MTSSWTKEHNEKTEGYRQISVCLVFISKDEKLWILVRISISIEVPQILINISEVEDDQWVDEHT